MPAGHAGLLVHPGVPDPAIGRATVASVAGGKGISTLARDTVFAAVMITFDGIVGVCLLVGALRQHRVSFDAEGTGAALATITRLAVLTMVCRRSPPARPGGVLAGPARVRGGQVAVAISVTLVLVPRRFPELA